MQYSWSFELAPQLLGFQTAKKSSKINDFPLFKKSTSNNVFQ